MWKAERDKGAGDDTPNKKPAQHNYSLPEGAAYSSLFPHRIRSLYV